MKKRFFALVCALVLLCGAVQASALEGESARAADTLAALGLVRGSAAGDYALDAPATRGQAAALLVRLAGAEHARDPWRAGFRDLDPWCAPAVHYAAHQGWLTDIASPDFHPRAAVTADEWCAMLLRMLGYRDKDGDFAAESAAGFARHMGLLTRELSGPLTRGVLFESIRDVLTVPYHKGPECTVISHLVETGVCSRAAASALGLLDPVLTPRQIHDRCMPAVFCIEGFVTSTYLEVDMPTAHASGFFLTPDGLAATNYHAIAGSRFANAVLQDGETYAVESVVWYDKGLDLAVLRISKTSSNGRTVSMFPTLDVVGTEDLRVGEPVYALGNPLGLGLSLSEGILSARKEGSESYQHPLLMNTASISEGSSGGALVNAYGQAVGVAFGSFVRGNNMFLAVPADPLLTLDLSGPGTPLWQLPREKKAS